LWSYDGKKILLSEVRNGSKKYKWGNDFKITKTSKKYRETVIINFVTLITKSKYTELDELRKVKRRKKYTIKIYGINKSSEINGNRIKYQKVQ